MNGRQLAIAIYLEAVAMIASRRLIGIGRTDILDVFSRIRALWAVALEWHEEGHDIDWEAVAKRTMELLGRIEE